MKSWADHCSSDEESDLEDRVSKLKVEPEPELPLQEEQENDVAHVQNEGPESPLGEAGKTGTGPPDDHQQQHHHQHHHHHHQQRPRTYDFPELSPYTAFVGNLAYSVRDSSDLANAIVDLVHNRLGRTIVVKDARIAYGNDRDRNEKKHRGFGYVEVETLDDLKLMMELNETGATLSGRKIQLDTANHKNKRNSNNNNNIPSGAAPEIDGRHFRGGRYSNQGGGAPGGRRNSHNNSNNRRSSGVGGGRGGHHHHNHHHNGSHDNAEPKQRPSLKLQPRTKPVEKDSHQHQSTNAANKSGLGLEDQSSGSAQNIFGRGKARDESSWKDRPPKKSHDEDQQPSQRRRSGNTTGGRGGNTGGRGGRGGRGGGGGGGGGGRHRHHHHSRHSANSNNNNNNNNQGGGRKDRKNLSAQREEKKKPNVIQQNTETQKQAPPKKPVSNKFAALQFDSDSD